MNEIIKLTFPALIQAFLVKCEQRNLSTSTMDAYQIALRQFHKFILAKDGTLSDENVAAYFEALHNNFSQATFNQKFAIISQFLDFLAEEHLIPHNPATTLPYKQIKQRYTGNTVDIDALTEILKCAHRRKELFLGDEDGRYYRSALRDTAVLELMVLTGIRVSEICLLGIDDVDLEEKKIHITGLRGHERTIHLNSDSTIQTLTEYKNIFWLDMAEAGSFFVNRCGKPLSTQSVRNTVKRYAEQANISQTFTPKNLRDSLAVLLLERGSNMMSIQQLMGHSTLATTKKYITKRDCCIIATPLVEPE